MYPFVNYVSLVAASAVFLVIILCPEIAKPRAFLQQTIGANAKIVPRCVAAKAVALVALC